MTDPYRIFETDSFAKDLERLPERLRKRIRARLAAVIYPQLRAQPYFGPNIKKLRDWAPETWRYRLGGWRIFFQADDQKRTVFLLTVALRRDAY